MVPTIKKYFGKAPIAFYLIALFHIFLTISEFVNYLGDTSVYLIYSLRPVILLAYTIFWIGCCFMKRWAGLAYLILTLFNVSFHLFGPPSILKQAVGDLLFLPIPVNLLFCFLILYYFKRMQVKPVHPIEEKELSKL